MYRVVVRSGLCCVGFAVLAMGAASLVRAESALEFWINRNHRAVPAPLFPSEPREVIRKVPVQPRVKERPRHQTRRKPATNAPRAAKRSEKQPEDWRPTANLERVVCKRQCDGAELAFGIFPARDTRRDAEKMCAAAGGSAETELVVEKFERDSAFQSGPGLAAVKLESGRAATAGRPDPCPSGARQGYMMVPILADATLRWGDIVATDHGFKMFVGKGRPPFRDKDFVDASRRMKKMAISNREPVPEASIETPPDTEMWSLHR